MSNSSRNSRTNELDLDLSGNKVPNSATLLGNAGVQLDVDLNKPGKQHGHLKLPVAAHTGAPHQLRIPVCIIKSDKPGPNVTVIGGIHGDEYEGSITIKRLARTLSADDVHGRLILLPSINPAGQQAGLRYNPADGQNIDYAFPGHEDGSPSECLARHITQQFIEPSDTVVDLRSGGRYLKFVPSVAVRFNANSKAQSNAENAMIAFGAPNSLRLPASASQSCLQGWVNTLGKDYIQAELGGGGYYDIQTLSMAHTGCLNILRHLGILNEALTLAATRLLEVRDDSYYVFSPADGLFEPLAYLGEAVWEDAPIAHVHCIGDTSRQPTKIHPTRTATLIASYAGGMVKAGDLIAVLAEEVQA